MSTRFLAALAVLALSGCSSFTVRAELSEQVSGRWSESIDGRDLTHQPVGRVAVAFEPQLSPAVSASLGVEHRSYPSTYRDRGEERAYLGLTWRPFGDKP